jgi:hypothetical protein
MRVFSGGGVPRATWIFDNEFFVMWEQQIVVLEDYSYVKMDSRGHMGLSLPLEKSWGIGGKYLILVLILESGWFQVAIGPSFLTPLSYLLT